MTIRAVLTRGFLVASFAGAIIAAAPKVHAEADPTFQVREDNPIMAQAYRDAAETLPAFLRHAMQGDEGRPNALIKVAIATTRPNAVNDNEIIWIAPFQRRGQTTWAGALSNEPRELLGLGRGDTVRFNSDQIVDWAWITEDGTFYGSYTLRALLELGQVTAQDLPPLSRDPLPAGW